MDEKKIITFEVEAEDFDEEQTAMDLEGIEFGEIGDFEGKADDDDDYEPGEDQD